LHRAPASLRQNAGGGVSLRLYGSKLPNSAVDLSRERLHLG
jgi:hypothetical protein